MTVKKRAKGEVQTSLSSMSEDLKHDKSEFSLHLTHFLGILASCEELRVILISLFDGVDI